MDILILEAQKIVALSRNDSAQAFLSTTAGFFLFENALNKSVFDISKKLINK